MPPLSHLREAAEARALSSPSKNGSLTATLDAAELCMRALDLTADQTEKRNIAKKCHQLLDQAERLRSGNESSAPAEPSDEVASAKTNHPRLKIPVPSRQLTTREHIILLKGSKLHGSVFPPWKSDPEPCEFDLLGGYSQYIDEANLPLSEDQLEVFNGWRRPDELLSAFSATGGATVLMCSPPSMTAHGSVDLIQDVTTDCSFVASLCAGTARAERGHSKILSSIMHPYDHQAMKPALSRNGKYIFKLHFNGCFRKVIIDDRLPSSRTSRSLWVIDRQNPNLLWPALMEKAYLKVRGGYDLPGSNSGTDIWVLTSWIPEQLFLQSDGLVRQSLWDRLYKAYKYGDVLITMGTGKLTQTEEDCMGLAGEHDYAVLAMKEFGDRKLMLIKNPWAEGTIWKGDVNYGQPSGFSIDLQHTIDTNGKLAQAQSLTPGTFWMDLNDIFQSFESIYLNWNPGLFSHREDFHFSWNLTGTHNYAGSFRANPQYKVFSSAGGVVWVLLSRHFKSRDQAKGREVGESAGVGVNDRGYISLYAHANNGERVFRSDGALLRGHYVDSPNTLLKLDIPVNTAYTIVVSEQALPRSTFNFTLSAFSMKPLLIEEAKERYKHHVFQQGAWTPSTSGGNASSAIYYINPQYNVRLLERSDLSLLLESENEDLPVHFKLVWPQGKSITSIKTRDIVGDSGEYQSGYASTELCNVEAGVYTIVCSTFDPGQLGKFSVRVGSMSRCIVDRVLTLEAGRLAYKVEPAIFCDGNDRLLAPLTLGRITRLFTTALWNSQSTVRNGPRSPLKLALEYGRGSNKQVLAASCDDEFVDTHIGVRTPDVDVQPSMCHSRGLWIVIERLGRTGLQQDVERIDVEVLSDAPIELGKWVAGGE